MPCTCNAICDNDCSVNQLCTGHVPTCVNEWGYIWTPSGGGIVRNYHIKSLENSINNERTNTGRRYTASDPAYCATHTPGDVACSSNDFSTFSFSSSGVGDPIEAQDYDDVKDAIDEVVDDSGYGTNVSANFIAQGVDPVNSVILAASVLELQTRIQTLRTICICDSHCNCDPSDCGCNGECPNDDYYYYYP